MLLRWQMPSGTVLRQPGQDDMQSQLAGRELRGLDYLFCLSRWPAGRAAWRRCRSEAIQIIVCALVGPIIIIIIIIIVMECVSLEDGCCCGVRYWLVFPNGICTTVWDMWGNWAAALVYTGYFTYTSGSAPAEWPRGWQHALLGSTANPLNASLPSRNQKSAEWW